MSGPLSDCYVLAVSRSSADALRFLQTFVPDHTFQWDESDPSDVLGVSPGLTLPELTQFLEAHPQLSYSMYFRNNSGSAPYFAILSYCSDGALIYGLCGDEPEASAMALLNRLEAHAGSLGYWSVEEAPACSKQEFFTRAGNVPNNSFKPKPLRGSA